MWTKVVGRCRVRQDTPLLGKVLCSGTTYDGELEDTILFLLAGSLNRTLSMFLCLFTSFSHTPWATRISSCHTHTHTHTHHHHKCPNTKRCKLTLEFHKLLCHRLTLAFLQTPSYSSNGFTTLASILSIWTIIKYPFNLSFNRHPIRDNKFR